MTNIFQNAYDTMIKVCSKCAIETGGVACGVVDTHLVVYAGGPGPNARHSLTAFENDREQDAKTLALARAKYGNTIHPTLYYHLHPFNMPNPSGTDWNTIAAIHKIRGLDYPLLMGIFSPTGSHGSLELNLYKYNGLDKPTENVPYKIISDNDQEAMALIAHSPATLDVTPSNSDFWSNTGFQFYHTARGKIRIRRDMEDLNKAGFKVESFQAYPSLHCVLLVHTNKGLIKLCCPPEFPINPPRIYSPSGHEFILATLQQWNSDRQTVDVIKECVKLMTNYWPRFLSPTSKEPSWLRNHGQ